MLTLVVPDIELYDEENEQFINIKGTTLKLEHSLVAIAKWESKWKVPFLELENVDGEKLTDYIKCMTITQNVNPQIFEYIDSGSRRKIVDYIEDEMTATTIHGSSGQGKGKARKELVTAELIYYWMISKGIPMECQKWHVNRLLTLINVYNIKESSGNKMSKKDLAQRNREMNRQRRAQWNTKG